MAFKYADTGKICNLFSSDSYAVFVSLNLLYLFFSFPMLIFFVTLYAVNDFGLLGMLLPLLLCLNVAFVFFSSSFSESFLRSKASIVDKRCKLMTETLKNVQSIKFNAWESIITEKILGFKNRESGFIRSFICVYITSETITSSFPTIVIVVMVSLYNAFYSDFDLPKAISIIAYAGMLMQPSTQFGLMINAYRTSKVALGRIDTFLNMPENKEKEDKD